MVTRITSTEIKEAIRKRIVLSQDTDEFVLHEGKLAEEFGVSRTPIRQVLQALAAERLVTTRSGIGTIVVEMPKERLAADQRSYATLLNASQNEVVEAWTDTSTLAFQTFLLLADRAYSSKTIEAYYSAVAQLVDALRSVLEDDIMAEALTSMHWRFVRRRVEANDANEVYLCVELDHIAKDIRSAVAGTDPSLCFSQLSERVQKLIK